MKKLSYKSVSQWLGYDPRSGNLYWLKGQRGVFAGAIAGYRMPSSRRGYIQVGYNKRLYYAHKIAWLLMTKKWPTHEIDHKNGNGSDNRWENLRPCTRSENLGNQKRHFDRINNLPKGVYFASWAKSRPFYSRIYVRGRNYRLGYFSSAQKAHQAYLEAAKHHFGKFARAN